jgi:hypothetical protein
MKDVRTWRDEKGRVHGYDSRGKDRILCEAKLREDGSWASTSWTCNRWASTEVDGHSYCTQHARMHEAGTL